MLPDQRIEEMMKESGASYMNPLFRMLYLTWESNGGKLDFSAYHLSVEIAKQAGKNYPLDGDDIPNLDKGPFFIPGSSSIAYNHMDAGNWLWGNANNRLGNSVFKAKQLATMFNTKDSDADIRAIIAGWLYQAGFRTSAVSNK